MLKREKVNPRGEDKGDGIKMGSFVQGKLKFYVVDIL